MSHWDFGRPADGQQDTPRRSGPAGAAYPPDLPGRRRGGRRVAGQRRLAGADGGTAPARGRVARGLAADGMAGRDRPDEGWPAAGTRPPDERLGR